MRDDREMRLLCGGGGAIGGRGGRKEGRNEGGREGGKVERRALILLLSSFPRNDANGQGRGETRKEGRRVYPYMYT